MTEKRFTINGKEIIQDKQVWCMANSEHCADVISTAMNELYEENQRLKSDLAKVIEQERKNNELCVSDIRILEKALWCSGCENDYDRLRQLRKEFLK